MSIQDWAAIGEIVGAIAIVVTLIYLAVQIRDGNRETRAATIQSALDTEMEMISVLTKNAEIWDKVVTGAPLAAGGEMRKGILLFNLLMVETESRYHQFKAGYLDVESWEGRLPAMQTLVKNPIYEIWRSSLGGKAHSTRKECLLSARRRHRRLSLSRCFLRLLPGKKQTLGPPSGVEA